MSLGLAETRASSNFCSYNAIKIGMLYDGSFRAPDELHRVVCISVPWLIIALHAMNLA